MNWISRLERKFGRFAIPNLMYVIIILYAVGFLLNILNPYFYIQYLSLNVSEILLSLIHISSVIGSVSKS